MNSDIELWQLAYTSTATHIPYRNDLLMLLDQSVIKNKRLNITGMLLFRDDQFMQVIEGPKDNLHELYQTIEQDGRHHHLILLWDEPNEQRDFAHWWMGFENLSQDAIEHDGFLCMQSQKFEKIVSQSSDTINLKSQAWDFLKSFALKDA